MNAIQSAQPGKSLLLHLGQRECKPKCRQTHGIRVSATVKTQQPDAPMSRLFAVHFLLPILADGFGCFIQPLPIRQQRDQFIGTEKLHRIRVRSAQWPQFAMPEIREATQKRQFMAIVRSKPPARIVPDIVPMKACKSAA
jgi:hypothetical protein